MRDLAVRLLKATPTGSPSARGKVQQHAAVEVCERLRVALGRFAGSDGCSALIRRALSLARIDAPVLQQVGLGPDGRVEGLEDVAADDRGDEGVVVLAAHILDLLVTFIGLPLTLRLIRDGWPDVDLSRDESSET